MERNAAEQVDHMRETLDERMSALTLAVSEAVERNMVSLTGRVDAQLGAVAETVALRAAEAADIAVASTFEQTLERLKATADSIDSMGITLVETLVTSRAQTEERMSEHMDDRLAALAKMIRSDNRVIAERLSASPAPSSAGIDGDIAKQTLRAVKELQAGMGTDVVGAVERKFQSMSDQLHKETQSTAEAMVKVAEVLGEKMDRLSVRVDEGVGGDLQIVIDRMSDAIQAMSGQHRRDLGRRSGKRTSASPLRIANSVVPSRSTVTQSSAVAVRVSASSDRTRPPATISSPMKTGERNCADRRTTFAGSPAQVETQAPRCPMVNMPWAMMPGKPTMRATSSS
jgi:hypothetical protein